MYIHIYYLVCFSLSVCVPYDTPINRLEISPEPYSGVHMCTQCESVEKRKARIAYVKKMLIMECGGIPLPPYATKLLYIVLNRKGHIVEIRITHATTFQEKSTKNPPNKDGALINSMSSDARRRLCPQSILLAARELWDGNVQVHAKNQSDENVWSVY